MPTFAEPVVSVTTVPPSVHPPAEAEVKPWKVEQSFEYWSTPPDSLKQPSLAPSLLVMRMIPPAPSENVDFGEEVPMPSRPLVLSQKNCVELAAKEPALLNWMAPVEPAAEPLPDRHTPFIAKHPAAISMPFAKVEVAVELLEKLVAAISPAKLEPEIVEAEMVTPERFLMICESAMLLVEPPLEYGVGAELALE